MLSKIEWDSIFELLIEEGKGAVDLEDLEDFRDHCASTGKSCLMARDDKIAFFFRTIRHMIRVRTGMKDRNGGKFAERAKLVAGMSEAMRTKIHKEYCSGKGFIEIAEINGLSTYQTSKALRRRINDKTARISSTDHAGRSEGPCEYSRKINKGNSRRPTLAEDSASGDQVQLGEDQGS